MPMCIWNEEELEQWKDSITDIIYEVGGKTNFSNFQELFMSFVQTFIQNSSGTVNTIF